MNFTYNPHRMILNKVTDCYLTGKDGEREEIQDDKLYHVVTDLYTGRMLGSVLDKSYGLISIVPKDKNGNPIENLEDYAVMDGKKELKAGLQSQNTCNPLKTQTKTELQMCRNIIIQHTKEKLQTTAKTS